MTEITQAYLKERLTYQAESGLFFWRTTTSTRIKPGQQAGTKDSNGYIRIKLGKRKYQAHRLAWMYIHGYFPPEDTDHINRIRDDNRIENLRPATRSENKRNSGGPYANNRIGYKGVTLRSSGKYAATYWDGTRNVRIGQFDTAEEASKAYAMFAPEPAAKPVQESLL